MSLVSDLRERVSALVFRARTERDLDEELRDHLEREVARLTGEGVAPAEARRRARQALGGVEQVKEDVRDARGVRPLVDLAGDVRHAVRALRRQPGFAFTAVLVLGLGIGAATAAFSVVDAVLLADLPYPDAGRLVRIYEKNSPTNRWSLSTVDADAIAREQRSFAAFGAVARADAAVSAGAGPEQLSVARASAGLFAALGVRAGAGRLLVAADERPEAASVAVVTYALAERVLGGAGRAVGSALTIDGVSHVVVGVLPRGADDLAGVRAAAWLALRPDAATRRGPFWLRGFARLKPGVTLRDAEADLARISTRLFPVWASTFSDRTARLTPVPLRDTIVGDAGRAVLLFGAAVALVLLIAVANVATLMLVRSAARAPELAVRAALGAGRLRLARVVLTECLVVGIGAGVVGLGVAAAGVRLTTVIAPRLPLIGSAGLHHRGVGFALVAALVCGVLVSLSPVASVLAKPAAAAPAGDPRRTGASRRAAAVREALVVAEFALAVPLLLGAGLLLGSLRRLERVEPGVDPDGVTVVSLGLPAARYPDYQALQDYWARLAARVAGLPAVTGVGLSTALPPDEPGTINNFDLLDRPVPEGTAQPIAPWSWVSPGLFAALRVPLLEGRDFTVADSGLAPPVVVVSRAWARHYFPGEAVVGRQLVSGGNTQAPPTTVIGVVGDVKYEGLAGASDAVYAPLAQFQPRSLHLMVRSDAPAATMAPLVREAVRSLDPQLAPTVTTLTERLEGSLADPRRWTGVLAAFAAAASLLAALGVFGLMAFAVRQRRREIGVRLALGAPPAEVTRMIVVRGLRYAALGTVLGLGLAAFAVRWLRALLFGIAPTDPPTVAAVTALLLLVALIAAWLPGRRAARIRPLEALAAE